MSGPKRVLLAVAPWLPVLIIGALTAFMEVFRRFAGLDDEGMFLNSLRFFNDGHTLYDDVFSQYGPVYHLVFGGFYKLTGIEIGLQSGRIIVVTIWLVAATAIGVAAKRLTGSLLIGVSAQAVAFGSASLLSGEPMHPVGLVCLSMVAIIFTFTTVRSNPVRAAALLGVIIGLLALVKINIGGLAGIAIIGAAGLTLSPLRDDRRARIAAIALLLLTAPGLMVLDLTSTSIAELVISMSAAIGAYVLVLTPDARTRVPPRVFWVIIATFFCVVLIVLTTNLAMGTSLHQLIDNIIVQPTRLRLVFWAPLNQPNAVIYIAIAAFAAAYVVRRSGLIGRDPKTPWPGIARIVVAIVIWGFILSNDPVGLGKSGRIMVPLALAWIALLPPGGWGDGSQAFTRTAVVLLSTMMVLHIYPVAGTQIEVAAMTFVPVGALILADGVSMLRTAPAWSIGGLDSAHIVSRMPALLGVLLAVFAFVAILAPLRTWGTSYRDNDSLALPTTGGMRLPANQTADYHAITKAIRRECGTLITMPGSSSFNIWSGLKPPDGFNSSDWVYLLDDREQGHILEQVKDRPRLCLVVNYSTLAVWRLVTRLGPLPRLPLTRFIAETPWREVVRGSDGSLLLFQRAEPGDSVVPVLGPGY